MKNFTNVSIGFPPELLKALDGIVEEKKKLAPNLQHSRSDAARELITIGMKERARRAGKK